MSMRLALGTVQFGLNYGVANTSGRVTLKEVQAILQRAQECDIDTIDTAIAYGDAEAILGKLGVRPWRVITKLPEVPNDCYDVAQWVRDQIQKSIARLQVDKLDGVLLHRPAQLLGPKGPSLYAALQSIKSEGMTCKIGVSVYEPAELDAVMDIYTLDLVQAPLNILDRRMVDSGWLRRLCDAGVEVHARSVFLQGLLLMSPGERPMRFNRWVNIWDEWDSWLCEVGVSPLQACLRYFNDLPQVDRVVVGVGSSLQLNQILEGSSGKLSSLPEFDLLEDDRLINPVTWGNL